MTNTTLSRKERRAVAAQAKKLYKTDSETAMLINDAYAALGRKDSQEAAAKAGAAIEREEGNIHPWIILGSVALNMLAKNEAMSFFETALKIDPKSATALAGLGTVQTMKGDVFNAIQSFETAIAEGVKDATMGILYNELMVRLHRYQKGAENLISLSKQIPNKNKAEKAQLMALAGKNYVQSQFFDKAIVAFNEAFELDPTQLEVRLGKVKADTYSHKYEDAYQRAIEIMEEGNEEGIVHYASLSRILGKHEEALNVLQDTFFDNMWLFQMATLIEANIYQDLGQHEKAEPAYREAGFIDQSGAAEARKVCGSYLMSLDQFAESGEFFFDRHPAQNRLNVPYSNSDPEALQSADVIVLMEEQGVGDQVALIGMAMKVISDIAGEKDLVYVAEDRVCSLLEGNSVGLKTMTHEEFSAGGLEGKKFVTVFPGDLARHIDPEALKEDPEYRFSGVLEASEVADEFKSRYENQAKGRPVIGVCWKSLGSLSGALRSVALRDILGKLPKDAMIVPLQYGDVADELARAREEFPEMEILDVEVDQINDLATYRDQLAALEHVITIDNTTAHFLGSLNTGARIDLLLPKGTECMWYWGLSDTPEGKDRWYKTMTVHRQAALRDWSSVLEEIETPKE